MFFGVAKMQHTTLDTTSNRHCATSRSIWFKETNGAACPFVLTSSSECSSVYLGFILKATGLKIQIREEIKWSWIKIASIDLGLGC